jgi:predicted NUDIX family NTP pyrophosphohydrolase
MTRQSAGILLYRFRGGVLEVLLVHPGGPYWAKKDDGAWSVPKGEFSDDEEPLGAARREFAEETGSPVDGTFIPLGTVKQPGGKTVHAWAIEGDFDPAAVRSNTFTLEWPPKSGRRQEFPEVDRAAWFSIPDARKKILTGQAELLERLMEYLGQERG